MVMNLIQQCWLCLSEVHSDELTQVHSTQSSLVVVTHPSTNRGWYALTSVNVPLSKLVTTASLHQVIPLGFIRQVTPLS